MLTATDEQAGAISGKLSELGGIVETHEVSDEALAAVAEAAPAADAETTDKPEATATPA